MPQLSVLAFEFPQTAKCGGRIPPSKKLQLADDSSVVQVGARNAQVELARETSSIGNLRIVEDKLSEVHN